MQQLVYLLKICWIKAKKFLVDGSSTHKKVKNVNKNNVTKISQPIQRCFNEEKMFEISDE